MDHTEPPAEDSFDRRLRAAAGRLIAADLGVVLGLGGRLRRVGRAAAPAVELLRGAFARLQPQLVRSAARRLAGDRELAQDVVQDAFVTVLAHFTREADTINNIDAYLTTSVRNAVCRTIRNRAVTVATVGDDVLAEIPAPRSEPDAADLDLRAAIDSLPPRERQCVVLRYFDDYSNRQIAATLGIAEGNVASTLASARRRLERIVDHERTVGGRRPAAG